MRMVSIFWKISKPGATATRAHSLTFYVPARLNRYPRITDAGEFSAPGRAGALLKMTDFWKSSAPGSAVAPDRRLVQEVMFLENDLPQAAQLPQTGDLLKKSDF